MPRRFKLGRRSYTPVVEFPCECGGKSWVGRGANGEAALLHTLPYCQEFHDLEPDEFLRRNRERIAKGEN